MWREGRGIAQSKVAMECGFSSSKLNKFERLELELKPAEVKTIAEKLDVNETFLETGSGYIFSPDPADKKKTGNLVRITLPETAEEGPDIYLLRRLLRSERRFYVTLWTASLPSGPRDPFDITVYLIDVMDKDNNVFLFRRQDHDAGFGAYDEVLYKVSTLVPDAQISVSQLPMTDEFMNAMANNWANLTRRQLNEFLRIMSASQKRETLASFMKAVNSDEPPGTGEKVDDVLRRLASLRPDDRDRFLSMFGLEGHICRVNKTKFTEIPEWRQEQPNEQADKTSSSRDDRLETE